MAFWNSSYDDPLDYTELWGPSTLRKRDVPEFIHNLKRDCENQKEFNRKLNEKKWYDNVDNQAFSHYCYSLDSIARDLADSANPNDRNVQEEICARYGYSLHTLTDGDKKYIEQAIENF